MRNFNDLILNMLACGVLMSIHMGSVMAQSNEVTFWNDELYAIAKSESTPDWIEFRESNEIDPLTVFVQHKAAFGLMGDDQMQLQRTESDQLGYQHFRYQQYYQGLKVEGGEFIVHQNAEGVVYSANGKMVRGLSMSVNPLIAPDAVIQIALNHVSAKTYYWEIEFWENLLKEKTNNPDATHYPQPELMVCRSRNAEAFKAENFRLAYKVEVHAFDPSIREELFIDAQTGEIFNKIPLSIECSAGTVNTNHYGSTTIHTDPISGGYRLYKDCTSTGDIHVRDWNGAGAVSPPPPNPTEITSTNNTWNNNTNQEFGASTLWALDWALWYFKSVFNRNSWNNNNGDLDVFINAVYSSSGGGTYTSNATYNGNGVMTVGIGNPDYQFPDPACIASDPLEDALNTVDIMAHELGHGVDQGSANLTYQDESGALDESFADIYGCMTEVRALGSNDWLIGAERCTGAIRSISDPNDMDDPDTYNGTHWAPTGSGQPDNGGVHTNSGVQNYWFYLLSVGGSGTNDNGNNYSVTGIGHTQAEQIAYRNHTVYLTSSATYVDARQGAIKAAGDLYGECSFVQLQTVYAWHAVGVGDSWFYDFDISNTIPSGTFTAYNIINSPGSGSATNGTGTVTLRAGGHVYLNPGFKATATGSSTFHARAQICRDFGRLGSFPNDEQIDDPFTANTFSQELNVSIYPNPFKSETTIELQVANEEERVTVEVYDLVGKRVAQLANNETFSSGIHKLTFNSAEHAGNFFICRVKIGSQEFTKKIVKME